MASLRRIYVKINDTKIVYEGDADNIRKPAWHLWNIDLTTLGETLRFVEKLTIGIEGGDAMGVIYVDDKQCCTCAG